jgi:Domain of unknown function (DUF1842)
MPPNLRSDTVSYVSLTQGIRVVAAADDAARNWRGNIVTQTNTVTQHKTLHFTASTGLPGAPTLQMTLIYDTEKRTLGGTGVITQAVAPPGGRIDVQGIHGEVTDLKAGFRLLTVRGSCTEPPAMVIFDFSAAFVIDRKNWNGEGIFNYGPKTVGPVPVEGAALVPAQG